MDIETLQLQIYQWNDDERFYRDYYYARKNPETLVPFLDSLDMKDVLHRHLLILEKKETIPPRFEDYFFFDPAKNERILVQRHNRYAPAIFHNHTFFELLYVYDGTCTQKLNHTEFQLHTGDICIIPPGIDHAIWVDDDSIILNVLIRKASLHNIFFNFLNTNNSLSSFFLNNIYAQKANDYILFHCGPNREIQHGFLYMYWETMNQELYYQGLISNTLLIVFGLLIRNYAHTIEMPIFAKKEDVQRYALLQYIQEHYASVKLSDVAAKFHYTPEYASALIKSTTGMTFSEITQKIRIEKAQDMLSNTNLSVASISEKVGYATPEYFIRLFKKQTQMTPSAYRASHTNRIMR